MTPTPEQIQKLPKWAQDHLASLTRQRDEAVRALRQWRDDQTESHVYIDEHLCDKDSGGPSSYRRYVQARSVEFLWSGIHLQVTLHKDSSMYDEGIQLKWNYGENIACRHVAFIPESFQSARLIAPENLRTR